MSNDRNNKMTHNHTASGNRERNRGVALVTSLLLLSLFTVMTLSMVIATTSDTLIDGYYRNARGSFYAADSGINAARQALLNQVAANALPSTYTPSSGSPVMTSPATLLGHITSSTTGFGSYNSILGSSSSTSGASWPGTFELDTTKTTFGYATPACTPAPQCSNGSTTPVTAATPYQYFYAYHLVADGQSRSGETNVVEEYGTITYTINMNPSTSTTTSFAAYGTLLDKYALCNAGGGPFVPGTMSGKVFSNQGWNFGDATANGSSTKYVFTGNVGAVDSQVGYYYGAGSGTCDLSSSTSDTHSGVTINPTFSGGLSLGQSAIALPANSYNQLSAVLDGLGDCPPAPASCSAPAQAAMAVLQNAHGTPYPASGSTPSTGVYMPYTVVGGVKTLNSNAGGIYVQGNASQILMSTSTVTVSGSPHTEQLIQISQGSTTTTVTLDLTGGTTRMTDNSGNDTGIMSGLPTDLNNSPATEGCLVYVTGNISSNTSSSTPTGLSGPSSGAAVANGSAITIVSGGTIDITGNITYATEPVSLTTADTPVSPAPTNVLGIYTSGGNVELKPPSNVATMEIDASIATMATGQSYGITAVWNTITNVNIVGGRVQNMALNGSSVTARNIYFDQRFASGFAPPWFPTTTITTTTTNTASPATPTANRTSWVNSSAQ